MCYRATTILFCILQHISRTDSGVLFDDRLLHTIVTPIQRFWCAVMLEGLVRKIDHTLRQRDRVERLELGNLFHENPLR
jgi:hypothetical protein